MIIGLTSWVGQVDAQTQPSLQKLAYHPQWLRLLHYEHQQSTFISERFFLSRTGKTDPYAELIATLKAATQNIQNDQHPRCRFPARYLWLSKQLRKPELSQIPKACRMLNAWLAENPITQIDLILVSGYMGNPASLFGHTLLKLPNTQKQDLFSSTINYGAQVPPDENIFRYIFKGIFGGYTAQFTDSYYYNADLMYGHTEQRDSWTYTLKLTPTQRTLLQYHLWEVLHQQKKYYFLTKNCAYEMGNAIRAALPDMTLSNNGLWYLPQQLPEDLLHKHRVSQVTYHPSAEKILLAHYQLLSKAQKQLADQFMAADNAQKQYMLTQLPKTRSLINFLLTYQYYLYEKERPNVSAETLALKRKLLALRFQLPPDKKPWTVSLPARPAPTETQKSRSLSLLQRGDTLQLEFAPFSMDENGWNALEGDRLKLLNISVSRTMHTAATTYQLDFIDIAHYARTPLPLSTPWSWKVKLSINKPADRWHGQGLFSIGKTLHYKNHLALTFFASAQLQTQTPNFTAYPELFLTLPINKHRLNTNYQFKYDQNRKRWYQHLETALQFNLSNHLAVKLHGAKYDTLTELGAGIQLFW